MTGEREQALASILPGMTERQAMAFWAQFTHDEASKILQTLAHGFMREFDVE